MTPDAYNLGTWQKNIISRHKIGLFPEEHIQEL